MGFEEKLTYYAEKMAPTCRENDSISDELFTKYGVYRGLRDLNGKGVVTGLTNISKTEKEFPVTANCGTVDIR